MIEPERRAEIKAALVKAIETADPSRVGRADTTAEGLILVAEIIPRVAEAIAATRDDRGTAVPVAEVALRMIRDYQAGRIDDEPRHEARSEQLLGNAIADLNRSIPSEMITGPVATETNFTADEHEAMRLVNEAIRRARGGAPPGAPEGEG